MFFIIHIGKKICYQLVNIFMMPRQIKNSTLGITFLLLLVKSQMTWCTDRVHTRISHDLN